MTVRKITVDGQEFEWIVTTNVHNAPEAIVAQMERGQFCGVVIWDKDRKQYKAPIFDLTAMPVVSITPAVVETWIKEHILGAAI